jgi:hypothetical protein
LKVDCVQGEIIEPTGICDIQYCKCLCSFWKYMILIPILWK